MKKVICNQAKTCKHRLICGAAQPHWYTSCEPCPYDKTAECVEVTEEQPATAAKGAKE